MPTYNINFSTNIINDSLQVGDYAYSVQINSFPQGGFTYSLFSQTSLFDNFQPILLGVIIGIAPNSIVISDDDVGDGTAVTAGDFFMFGKDSRINLSGLVGYYAEAVFKNNSNERAEMYSIGSEITPSSK